MERKEERIRIVVDSNIIFSLIIKGKDSAYLDIFSNDNIEMYAPEDLLYEFKKYQKELKKRSEEFEEILFIVFSFIRIIPQEFYRDKIKKAHSICEKFDEKDSPFIGLALKLNIPIWTNDKGILKNKGEYQTIAINELKKLLEH